MDTPVQQSGPDPHDETFFYVDIGSVDNTIKQIAERKEIAVSAAPSRAKQILRQGDVLVSMTRPNLNAVALVRQELDGAIGSTGFHVLRSRSTEPSWLFYAVQTQDFVSAMCDVVQGALYPAIRPKDIAGWVCPIPPRHEQQRIADMLDELLSDLDAGVAALERVRAKLKHYRAAVLKAAVEGTLTAEWRREHPVTETADALLTRILAERRCRWEDAQLAKFAAAGKTPPNGWKSRYPEPAEPEALNLPALPDDWCWASFDRVCEIQGGLQKQPGRAPRGHHFPYLRVANVHRGTLDLSEMKRFELTEAELSRHRLQTGDLLIVEGNGSRTEIGRCALWKGEIVECVHQNHIIRARLMAGIIPKFADQFLNSPTGQNAIQTVASSTSGLYTLSVSKIAKLPIPIPPTQEQEAIVEAVEDQLSVIHHLEQDLEVRLQGAQALRQSILRCAFSGQLVPQDPNDEPASELLKRIAAEREERARLARAAKQARPKSTSKPRTPRRAAKQQ